MDGTAFRLGLPASPAFTLEQDTTDPSTGAHQRTWRRLAGPGQTHCIVIAVEQPAFTGAFPESIIDYYPLSGTNRTVLRNVATPPPPGATGAIDQESTFMIRGDAATQVPGHGWDRHFLTPGRTLLSLSIAGPQSAIADCRLTEIEQSFAPSGQEFQTPPVSG